MYALLADVIRTLDVADDGTRQFLTGEQEAVERARRFVTQALAEATGNNSHDLRIRASAAEVQAHLAFRADDAESRLEQVNEALRAYLDAGSLAGVEGIERLLGMSEMQAGERTSGEESRSARQAALRHLSLSRELSEFLRERIPADQDGASQAGFFARRAYVNEQIIDLLVQDGRAAEALHVAEAAKARSLQDLLATNRSARAANGAPPVDPADEHSLADLLDDWPADTAALEYFIGSRKSWLFVVDRRGHVSAFDLLGAPRESRELVTDVRQFLNSVEGQSTRMRQRLLSGKGFDHSWQDALHAFRETLLPADVLESLRQARTVIVVPHHILHYFPFAALVTERDERKRSAYQMVQPRFLIDEQFDLVYAPSLGVWNRLRSQPLQPIEAVGAVGIVDFPAAPQLPGVEEDLRNLKEAFGDKVDRVLFAEAATETNAAQILARPGLVVFATHGFNQPDRPLESYLLCLQDGQDDGQLTAAELFGLDIRSDLIVLSACYSGLADRSPLPGDDLFGIQRALLQSGARTVVSGLWDVYDGTGPLLMKGFFEHLAAGRPAPAALAASQRAFVIEHRSTDGDPWLHPYFWAVYTAAGDDRTRIRTD